MNKRIKRNRKSGRSLAGLLVLILGLTLWVQPVLVGNASNSLGSQGNTVEGGSEGGGDAQDTGGEQDAVVDEIIGENTEDLGSTSTASKVTMKSSSVRVRGEASTNAEVVGSLSSGDTMDVVGETNGSDGMLWYQIKGEKDGKAIDGFVRSDLVEVTETAQPETPDPAPETEAPAEQPSDTGESTFSEYDATYADDGTGVSDWFLNDNINGNRYKISDLLEAQQINESNIEKMDEQTGRMRMIIIILAVIIGLLVVILTFLIFKLKGAYGSEYDGYDDDEGDDEEEDEEEDVEEDYHRGRKREPVRGRRRASSGRGRYEDEEDDEDDEDRYDDEEDDEDDIRYEDDEDDVPRRSRRGQSDRYQRSSRQSGGRDSHPRNFLEDDEDDDLDFEFLDLK